MSDDVSNPTAEASDESDIETDPEKIKSRMEKCEEELRHLRSPAVPGLSVTEVPVERYQLQDLLHQIMPALADRYDTTFLTDYLRVLQSEDEAVIKSVTYNVMASIEDALRQHMSAGAGDDECALGEQRVVLCAFLSAAALAEAPRVRGARPVLRQLLAYTTETERVLLARGWWRALPAAALVALSDAVRAPRRAAPHAAHSLAELLLRAALCRLPPPAPGSPPWRLGAPKLDDLEGVLGAWERQQTFAATADAERVLLLGRVLAVAPAPLRPALLRRLAASKPALLNDKLAAARAERKVGVCKLQILFGAEDKIQTAAKSRPRQDAAGRVPSQ